ncbi:MAG TPA: hypothetical protein VFZ59_13970 [Verrucomicrobiae bacterium]|nr:hypothetical protein [Verrucomicrobiae bacterium]
MKAKLKTIVLTFIATTAFWCLLIGCVFWFFAERSALTFAETAPLRGYVAMFSTWNTNSQPVTFTVGELRTNAASEEDAQVILFERRVPPSGHLLFGIKK